MGSVRWVKTNSLLISKARRLSSKEANQTTRVWSDAPESIDRAVYIIRFSKYILRCAQHPSPTPFGNKSSSPLKNIMQTRTSDRFDGGGQRKRPVRELIPRGRFPYKTLGRVRFPLLLRTNFDGHSRNKGKQHTAHHTPRAPTTQNQTKPNQTTYYY